MVGEGYIRLTGSNFHQAEYMTGKTKAELMALYEKALDNGHVALVPLMKKETK